jgi:uncharacterized protein (TIGR00255 family)
MIRSMTAFARSEEQTEWGVLVWELRSVNHRYLEISLRMPEEFRALETKVREQLQKRLGRGKVDCGLRFRSAAKTSAEPEIIINEPLVLELLKACEQVEDWMVNPARVAALDILKWQGAILEPEADLAPLHEEALKQLDAALDELIASREAEGERIQAMIEQRCASIADIVKQVRKRRPEVMAALREKLLQRIRDLEVEADPQRVEQELAMVAQKLDVDEELDRLDSHLVEIADVFKRNEPVGRRLDFLMQEFNRESNTLGSKSQDSETTRAAVDLKVLIEQMREQVQNIE